jgi:haloacetate dehalogenase
MTATPTGLSERTVQTGSGAVFVRIGGHGPPLLLLHGFPQTSLMWRDVVHGLLPSFTVVCADLPGYGQSDCPPHDDGPLAMSKRAMAATLVEAMGVLGHRRFGVAGHDRGGRVASRMAADHPAVVRRVAVLDVIPILDVWEHADARLTLAFWPFSLLAQDSPLPERLILGAPDAVVDGALGNWGTPSTTFPPDIRDAYVDALSDPSHVHAICDEYRAAASIDRDHDLAGRNRDQRIACPLLALWSGKGPLAEWYAAQGGPLAIWRRSAEHVEGQAVEGGHFFPEEFPFETAAQLLRFFADV